MGQTLSNGVYLPNEGERNCYAGLASNWQLLNTAVGNIAEKAPLVHTHGNITNDGKVGTTANLPLITGTGGAVQAGSFGNSANTFCEGNDSRLSDARTPVAHTHTKSDVTDLFNSANVWSKNNTFSADCIVYNSNNSGSTARLKLRNSKAEVLSTGNTPSDQNITFQDKNDVNFSYIKGAVQSNSVALKIGAYAKDSSNNTVNTELQLLAYTNGNKAIIPSTTNTYDFGTSSYKWKALNGVNPGALSLPDMDSTVSKTTELAAAIDKTQTANSWTADFTGILRITWYVKNLTGPFRCAVFNNADIRYATWGQTFSANDVWYFIISFPVQNGKTYYFDNSFTRTSEDTAPIVYGASAVYCLGNV